MGQPTAITAQQLLELLEAADRPRLIDVREAHELVGELGHIDGIEHIPLGRVPACVDQVRGETRVIISICKMGGRAMQAAQFWAAQGLTVRVLQGGMTAWNAEKLPTKKTR